MSNNANTFEPAPRLFPVLLRGAVVCAAIAIHTLALAKAHSPTANWRDHGGQPRAAVALSFASSQAADAPLETADKPPAPSEQPPPIPPAPETPGILEDKPVPPPSAQASPSKPVAENAPQPEQEIELEQAPEAPASSAANLAENEIDRTGVHEELQVSEPVFASQPKAPRYPTLARKRGQEGTVWIDIWLDEQGQQTRLAVFKSSGLEVLDAAALSAVGNWEFKPRLVDGIARASRVHIPVEFSLNSSH